MSVRVCVRERDEREIERERERVRPTIRQTDRERERKGERKVFQTSRIVKVTASSLLKTPLFSLSQEIFIPSHR